MLFLDYDKNASTNSDDQLTSPMPSISAILANLRSFRLMVAQSLSRWIRLVTRNVLLSKLR